MSDAEGVKVVAIGIGSASFGRGLLADLIGRPDLADVPLRLTLVDTSP